MISARTARGRDNGQNLFSAGEIESPIGKIVLKAKRDLAALAHFTFKRAKPDAKRAGIIDPRRTRDHFAAINADQGFIPIARNAEHGTAGKMNFEAGVAAADRHCSAVRAGRAGESFHAIGKPIPLDDDLEFADDLAERRALRALAEHDRKQNRSGDSRSGAHHRFPFPRKIAPHDARISSQSASRCLPADAAGRTAGISGAKPMQEMLAVSTFPRPVQSAAIGYALASAAIALGAGTGIAIGIVIEALQ